eukprot:524824-Rhodomonas_salina.1
MAAPLRTALQEVSNTGTRVPGYPGTGTHPGTMYSSAVQMSADSTFTTAKAACKQRMQHRSHTKLRNLVNLYDGVPGYRVPEYAYGNLSPSSPTRQNAKGGKGVLPGTRGLRHGGLQVVGWINNCAKMLKCKHRTTAALEFL